MFRQFKSYHILLPAMPQTTRPLGGRGRKAEECSDSYTEDLVIMY